MVITITDAELKRAKELAEAWLKPSPVAAENEFEANEVEMARLLLKAIGDIERQRDRYTICEKQ